MTSSTVPAVHSGPSSPVVRVIKGSWEVVDGRVVNRRYNGRVKENKRDKRITVGVCDLIHSDVILRKSIHESKRRRRREEMSSIGRHDVISL